MAQGLHAGRRTENAPLQKQNASVLSVTTDCPLCGKQIGNNYVLNEAITVCLLSAPLEQKV